MWQCAFCNHQSTQLIEAQQTGKAEATEEKDSSPEIKLDEPPKKKRKTNPEQAAAAITKITTTKDGNRVIATTGEDKSVLVFTFDEKNALQLLSQRYGYVYNWGWKLG